MRIFHIGIFEDHELGGDIIFNKGFIRNGVEVVNFDYRSYAKKYGLQRMNKEILERCTDNFDIVFIGKGELILPDTLREIKRKRLVTSLWFGDICVNPPEFLKYLLPYVDFFFMTSKGRMLRKYYSICRPKVGSYIINPVDPDLAYKYNLKVTKDLDIIFTGNFYKQISSERREVIYYLLNRKDVSFFGTLEKLLLWDKRFLMFLKKKYLERRFHPCVRGTEYINIIKRAKIGVGANNFFNVEGYFSDRLMHYGTFGTFFISNYFPGIEHLFEIGRDIVVYRNIDELDKFINYYLHNDEERETIANNLKSKLLEEYNNTKICKLILEIIQNGKSDLYEWIEIVK
ncbi:glycosyltransferase family protein [Anaerocellum danielii]|uniref:Glycosyltransferase n=1 Tax=Anaerocellum danielii TaxID=1387557 RepID=A0ABZ0TYF2_9FIRM|nr:glycosyltransferase [Caldicellulosiruptor danielii]WPX08498.1 glycosyltransferase [Caldicellulosiruptor danielii]